MQSKRLFERVYETMPTCEPKVAAPSALQSIIECDATGACVCVNVVHLSSPSEIRCRRCTRLTSSRLLCRLRVSANVLSD